MHKPIRGQDVNHSLPISKDLILCSVFNIGTGITIPDLSGREHHGTADAATVWDGAQALDLNTTAVNYGNAGRLANLFSKSATIHISFAQDTITSTTRDLCGKAFSATKWFQMQTLGASENVSVDIDADTDGGKRTLSTGPLGIRGSGQRSATFVKSDETNETLLYVDRHLEVTSTSTGDASNADNFWVGRGFSTGNFWLDRIFYIYVWDRALTQAEINTLDSFPMFDYQSPAPWMVAAAAGGATIPVFINHMRTQGIM